MAHHNVFDHDLPSQPSPTQPFPVGMPALGPLGFSPEDAWGFTAIDTWWCREKITPGSGGVLVTAGGLVFIG
ncbi:MAG: hypothetical protein KBG29_16335 [Pseudomonadales bacterium]|nr:hypothetical protein [Pseudomonadales bacterium]